MQALKYENALHKNRRSVNIFFIALIVEGLDYYFPKIIAFSERMILLNFIEPALGTNKIAGLNTLILRR